MKPWEKITPQDFEAMSEDQKRELARKVLQESWGESPLDPGNKMRDKLIENVLNSMGYRGENETETLDPRR